MVDRRDFLKMGAVAAAAPLAPQLAMAQGQPGGKTGRAMALRTETRRGFDQAEFQGRVQRLRAGLRARKLDLLIIDDNEATSYYFNHENSVGFYRAGLVPVEGEAFYVLRSLDVAPLRESSWVRDIVGFADWEDAPTAVAAKIRQRGYDHARIGVDFTSNAFTPHVLEALKRELPNAEFVDVDGLPRKQRKLKSKAEIEKLRKAAEIADVTIQEIARTVKTGLTAQDAQRIAIEAAIRLGVSPPIGSVFTIAKGWGFLHSDASDEPLRQGDVLHIELLCSFDGYSARMMREIVMGPISPQLDLISKKMIELQDKQIAAMKPGAIAKDVDRIMRQGAIDAGIREDYTNITAYTLGYYPERILRGSDFTWVFLPNSEWTLEEGMVFHVYTSGGGIAISETVLVGPNGGERLTKTARRLFRA